MSTVYDLADELINFSNRSIFLTGKAGTGKTTFLRNLKTKSLKQMAVVAPTGVAAVNAGGSTIHSFFQIAPGTLIPTKEATYQFLAKQQVTALRRAIFASLELLVIDEISMVRADLLDTIDIILRHYRYRRNEPFGGVQVILIGDMHQLPPVCNDNDWQLLQQFYQSPFFFHSQVMQELKPVYVEFDKIFRQTNMQFVDLLNNVRNNQVTARDFELLNQRYIPDFQPSDNEGYILLTTHNAKADVVNSSKLKELAAETHTFAARIKGDFPEKNYPADENLHLKVGAKVMFIANDKQPTKQYYNGKIGLISTIVDGEGVEVVCNDVDQPIFVSYETWNNVKYTHDKETNTISEDINGTFSQIPLRLAWAITIHKSQGLTFEKAIIDAGHAFSSGQVYVALSRCTSLDGIVLTSHINPHSLSIDENVSKYSSNKMELESLQSLAETSKHEYALAILKETFGFIDSHSLIADSVKYFLLYTSDFGEQSEVYFQSILSHSEDIFNVGQRFVRQLNSLFAEKADNIQERVAAASTYFEEKINELLSIIEASPVFTDSKTQAQDYVEKVSAIHELLSIRLWVIVGLKRDYSVNNYFAIKAAYKSPKVKIIAYTGATDRVRIKTNHPILYKMLATERNERCKETNMPVYVMATTKMLVAMSNLLPQTNEDLLRIKGFGKEKVKQYGEIFLNIIEQYCREHGLETSQRFDFGDDTDIDEDYIKPITKKKKKKADVEDTEVIPEKTKASKPPKEPKEPKVPSIDITLELLLEHKDIAVVAKERGLAIGTIWGHANKLLKAGRMEASLIVPQKDIDIIRAYYNTLEEKSLTSAYDHFNGYYPYEILRIATYTSVEEEEEEE